MKVLNKIRPEWRIFLQIFTFSAILLFPGILIGQREIPVKIGNQVWQQSNLSVDKFLNGDKIQLAQSDAEWIEAGKNRVPAWCYYEGQKFNGKKFGKLYNWFAVVDKRGLCPDGWHFPSNEEWLTLVHALGDSASFDLKSKELWKENLEETNRSGFSGLPGGSRFHTGSFFYLYKGGIWWTNSEVDSTHAWSISLYKDDPEVDSRKSDYRNGFSVRCLKN